MASRRIKKGVHINVMTLRRTYIEQARVHLICVPVFLITSSVNSITAFLM